jgi:hypothetical protein
MGGGARRDVFASAAAFFASPGVTSAKHSVEHASVTQRRGRSAQQDHHPAPTSVFLFRVAWGSSQPIAACGSLSVVGR